MLNLHLVRRQIAGSPRQAAVFILCVALSIITLVSLGGFGRSVHSSFLRDARALHAADIIIHSHSPVSPRLREAVAGLERRNIIESAAVHEFYSVVRTLRGDASLLADLKVVEPGYPFYGAVELASGRPFHAVLTPGSVVVEQALLDRLHLGIGDRLGIGNATLVVRDLVLQEPDRPVNFFALGPRIFVSSADLASLELVGKGSRVHYTILARVRDKNDADRIAGELKAASLPDRERVETYRTAESGVKRFLDNFLFFLNLIGIFTLLLAGIGIQSSLTAFLREHERTIAIMKAVGAGSRFIRGHYFFLVAVLGLIGTGLGLAASFLLEQTLPGLFRGFIPSSVELSISGSAVAEGLVLGFVVVVLFTLLPLYRLREVKPRAIFGKEEQQLAGRRETLLFAAAGALFFSALAVWRVREMKTGLFFVMGVGVLVLVSYACSLAVLAALKRLRRGGLVLRQALKGLFRPGNATVLILVTLTASLAVIFSLAVVEENLDATFVRSYPPDAPNLFFIDIQAGQKEAFVGELGMPAVYYPVVRGTVLAVNEERIDPEQERQRRRGDNLGREFNLTYRNNLLEDERIVTGNGLFRSDWRGPQVSVLDTVLDMRKMQVGDVVTFRIQGIPLEARISSIRTRTRAALQPFFYFVFPDDVLKDAPQTLFTAVRVNKGQIAPLQNRIAERFPNVSTVDVTETVKVFARVMERLSSIVRFFTLFSVVAGILLIVSSVFATRYARIQEAVYFTILGARGGFVLSVFTLESMLIGLVSGLIAFGLSQLISWIVCRTALNVAYQPFPGMGLIMVLATTLLVVMVGLGASVSIIRHRPAAFLREHAEE